MPDFIVEKCIEQVSNHFKLALLASQRVHDLNTGASNPVQAVKLKEHKNVVVALNEIAEKKVCVRELFVLLVGRCKEYMNGDLGKPHSSIEGRLQQLMNFSTSSSQDIQNDEVDGQGSNDDQEE